MAATDCETESTLTRGGGGEVLVQKVQILTLILGSCVSGACAVIRSVSPTGVFFLVLLFFLVFLIFLVLLVLLFFLVGVGSSSGGCGCEVMYDYLVVGAV